MYLTLPASLKIAAAIARHRSTSNPLQLPLWSRAENPYTPSLTPQLSAPRSSTTLRSCACADVAIEIVVSTATLKNARNLYHLIPAPIVTRERRIDSNYITQGL